MAFPRFTDPKDPEDTLDYKIDWSKAVLAPDSIQVSVFESISGGALIEREEHAKNSTTFWIAGGKPGELITIKNTITTATGRRFSRTVQVRVKDL